MSVCLPSVPECARVTFVVFSSCESCTRPVSTNPGSTEAGEYELTLDVFRGAPSRGDRGHRATVDLVVCFGPDVYFSLFFSFLVLRMHMGCCKSEAALPHLRLY